MRSALGIRRGRDLLVSPLLSSPLCLSLCHRLAAQQQKQKQKQTRRLANSSVCLAKLLFLRPAGRPARLISDQLRSDHRSTLDDQLTDVLTAVPQRSADVPTSYTYINSRVLCTSTTRVSGACDSIRFDWLRFTYLHCTQWFFLRPERPIGSGMQVCVCECCVCTVLCIMRWQQQSARKESRVESSVLVQCSLRKTWLRQRSHLLEQVFRFKDR